MIEIDEGQRQMVLLALAHLSVERPGWNTALREIATKMDDNRASYEVFRRLRISQRGPD